MVNTGGVTSPPTSNEALAEATARVGDRWTLLVVDALLDGPRRFGELSELVGGIAPNVLTARLRALETDGVLRSMPYSTRPVRLEYELTDAGHELGGVLALLGAWGRRQVGGSDRGGHSGQAGSGQAGSELAAPRAAHRACGTELVARLWCPTCDRPVDDPSHDDLEHL